MRSRLNSNLQQGFTLVELMVGLVIGLIATLVIMQTFSAFEGNKRSTTGISDAQTSGNIGLYMVQRELQFAGYGIPVASGTLPTIKDENMPYKSNKFQSFSASTPADLEAEMDAALATAKAAYEAQIAINTAQVQQGENYSALRCDPAPHLYLDLDEDPGTAPINVDVTTPAFITENGASDSITIIYGNTNRGSIPTRISSVDSATNKINVDTNISCRQDNVALILKDINKGHGNQCQAVRLKSSADGFNNAALDDDGNGDGVGKIVLVDPTTIDYSKVEPGDRLACIGKVQRITFAINGNQLTKDVNGSGAQPIVDEIVGLQAQYGLSANANSEIVDIDNPASWTDATGAWAAPLAVTNRNRIKAVRLALIARNNLYEKDIVSQECNGAASGPAKVCIWGGNAGLSATLGADWNHYRYRVYELIVPLKNVLSASPQL